MELICSNCNEDYAFIKSRCLCQRCYRKLRRNGSLPFLQKKSFEDARITILKNIVEKYGFSLIGELADLTHKQYATMHEIAEKHGITRERVRQFYKAIFRHGYRVKIKEKKEKRESDIMTCSKDPRSKIIEIKDGLVRKGAIAEAEFMNKCIELGYNVTPSCKTVIDQIVNGFNVEVKSSYNASKFNEKNIAKYHKFNISYKQLELADFFACYHGTSGSFFIIPKSEIKFRLSPDGISARSIFISEKILTHHSAKNRYWEFKDAWNLLDVKNYDMEVRQ